MAILNNNSKSAGNIVGCFHIKVSIAAAVFLSISLGTVQNVQAQQSIKVGETKVIPKLRLDYVSVDNAYFASSNPIEVTGVLLSPRVSWEAERRLLKISVSYDGVYGSYSEPELDFNDHDLTFRIDTSPGVRHRAFGEFSVSRSFEPLGTGQTTFVENPTKQVVSTQVRLETGYTFGVASAKGNLGGGLRIGTQTFNDVGEITQGDDNSEITPYAFFSYRLSPDTRFVTEVRFRLTDYDEDRRDRTEIGVLAGFDIAATERTGGRLRFGISQADYNTVGVSDTSQAISDVNLYFNPRSYSRLELTFSRTFITVDQDNTGPGAALVNSGRLTWNHEWTSQFSTLASLGLTQIERNCPNNDSAANSAGLEINVKVKSWLTAGAGVKSTSRTAALCDPTVATDGFDADSTSVGIHVIGSL